MNMKRSNTHLLTTRIGIKRGSRKAYKQAAKDIALETIPSLSSVLLFEKELRIFNNPIR